MKSTLSGGSAEGVSEAGAPHAAGGVARAETGVARAFEALLSGCAVYDLSSRAKIRLTGSDRVRWLNGMVTNNIRDLAPNHGVYCFLLNAQGHIQADFYAYNMGESIVVDADGQLREKILAHFDKFIIMDDVEVADVTSTLGTIGVAGPQAKAVLRAAGVDVPDLAPLELCSPKCNCACECLKCTVVRGDEAAGESYEIWLAPGQMRAAWDALIAAGGAAIDGAGGGATDLGTTDLETTGVDAGSAGAAAGADALELWRISRGIPRYGVDIRERDLPQETGQERALNFTKGCYLGQEIVERIRSRGAVHRQFSAFLVEGALPAAGTKIQVDEKDVGEITSSADLPLPAGNRGVALGYLRREAAGKGLRAGAAMLKPAALPII
ncbi:MAG: folate-binding protein [Terriglobales bacterium]